MEEGILQAQLRRYAAGSCLYEAGQPAMALYLVEKGSVVLSAPNLGRKMLVQQGHLIGLHDLMQEEHSHTAILAVEADIIEIPKQGLLKAIQTTAPLRLYLMRLLSRQPALAILAYE